MWFVIYWGISDDVKYEGGKGNYILLGVRSIMVFCCHAAATAGEDASESATPTYGWLARVSYRCVRAGLFGHGLQQLLW